MEHLWIILTIAAAALQTLRLMQQKRLKGLGLSTAGASFARFLYGAPLAVALLAVLLVRGYPAVPVSLSFAPYVMAGAVGQIFGTLCSVALFSERSFAVGTAFTKSETIQAAGFSALILAEPVSVLGLAAISLGTVGVLLLSFRPGGWGGLWNRGAALGLAGGAFFAISAIGYRGATLAVGSPDAFYRATLALAAVTTFQTVTMGLWLAWRDRAELGRVLAGWRATAPVGANSMAGSLLWFTAFALMNAAYVRALGQVELIFSVAASVLFFRETVSLRELCGIGLLALAVVGVVSVA
ncbi:EamA family transporter [Paragemmobacter straminiformis]|uniref:EamA family transporter n=1 Tax=Paragemmobacter straminiformis TaxID=2045119 RepID=A0A842IDZ6_9RHOB|nr:EamA family transporter [Gemmobacter straminiformis]MBC2837088.1 EamA family transporter [Gemmobacter straminiformis]